MPVNSAALFSGITRPRLWQRLSLLEGKVMLVHHVGWPEKMLGLVTGFLEAKEHPDEAIKREVKEETNLETKSLSFLGHYAFAEQNQLIMAYEAQCTGQVQLNEELDRFKLLEPEKLIPWPLGTGPAVRDWLALRGLVDGAGADASS